MNAVATQRMTMRHWGVLATCVFCTFGCAAVAFSVPGLCYRPVSQYLGVDVFDVSLYMTIVYLTEVVLSAPVGRLLQRFDMRIVCTAAACSTSLGFAAMSFYTELWQWYLSGWREVYLVLGLVAFALSVPFTLFAIRSHPEDVGLKAYGAVLEPSVAQVDGAGDALPGIPAKQAFRKWYFFALVFAGCMANIGGIFPQHFTTYYQSFVAVDRETLQAVGALMVMSGTLEAFTMAGMAGGKVLIGALESRSIQLALVIGCVGGFLGLSGIWIGGEAVILPVLFGGGMLYGLIYPFVTTLLPYLTRLIFGSKDYDRIYSVVLIPVNLVGAFAASGLALIYQNAGWDAFFIVGLASIVVIYLGFNVAYYAGRRVYLEKL